MNSRVSTLLTDHQTNHEDAADGKWKDQTTAHGSGWRKVTKADSQQRHIGPVDSIQVRPAFDFAHERALAGDGHVDDRSEDRVVESRAQRVSVTRGILSREVVGWTNPEIVIARASASAPDSQRAMPDPRVSRHALLFPQAECTVSILPASSGQAVDANHHRDGSWNRQCWLRHRSKSAGSAQQGQDRWLTLSIDRSGWHSRCSRKGCFAVDGTASPVQKVIMREVRMHRTSLTPDSKASGKTMTSEGQCAINIDGQGRSVFYLIFALIRLPAIFADEALHNAHCTASVAASKSKCGIESQQTNFTDKTCKGKWALTAHGGSNDGRARTKPHDRRTRWQAPSLAPAHARTLNVRSMHWNRRSRPITVDDDRCYAFAVVQVVVSNQPRDDFVASLLNQLVELFVGAIRFTGCSADKAESTVRVEVRPRGFATGNPNCGLSYPSGVGAGVV
ncbi:hypothetical protein KC368_g10 [Hortaea werneckii]|nr:hypothetical protein KC368_g10 [Hortaea werneckii]